EPGNQPNETSVAVNPRDPRQLIVSYQRPFTAAGVSRFGVYVAWSADGGEKWTVSRGAAPQNYLNSADPSVAFDLHGRAFVAYVAFDKFDNPGQIPYWARSGVSRAGAFVRRSVDGGRTWEASHT